MSICTLGPDFDHDGKVDEAKCMKIAFGQVTAGTEMMTSLWSSWKCWKIMKILLHQEWHLSDIYKKKNQIFKNVSDFWIFSIFSSFSIFWGVLCFLTFWCVFRCASISSSDDCDSLTHSLTDRLEIDSPIPPKVSSLRLRLWLNRLNRLIRHTTD